MARGGEDPQSSLFPEPLLGRQELGDGICYMGITTTFKEAHQPMAKTPLGCLSWVSPLEALGAWTGSAWDRWGDSQLEWEAVESGPHPGKGRAAEQGRRVWGRGQAWRVSCGWPAAQGSVACGWYRKEQRRGVLGAHIHSLAWGFECRNENTLKREPTRAGCTWAALWCGCEKEPSWKRRNCHERLARDRGTFFVFVLF